MNFMLVNFRLKMAKVMQAALGDAQTAGIPDAGFYSCRVLLNAAVDDEPDIGDATNRRAVGF